MTKTDKKFILALTWAVVFFFTSLSLVLEGRKFSAFVFMGGVIFLNILLEKITNK